MDFKPKSSSLVFMSSLSGQARIDALIDQLYSPDGLPFTGDQCMDLALPDINLVSELYKAASSSDIFKWPDEPLETRWRCLILGAFEVLDRDSQPEDYWAEMIKESLTEQRLEEIRSGSRLNDDEWQQVKEAYDVPGSERSEAVATFETTDSHGRSMYFVADFGDWGTLTGCHGPYSDSDDLLAYYTDDENKIFVEFDDGWQAFTPNWIDEIEEEYEDDIAV